jgi:hypothetical protein
VSSLHIVMDTCMQPLRLFADRLTLSAGGPCMSDADRTTFLTELADADNATASFILNGGLEGA